MTATNARNTRPRALPNTQRKVYGLEQRKEKWEAGPTCLQQARDATDGLHGCRLRAKSASVRSAHLIAHPLLQNGSDYAQKGKGEILGAQRL
jgi:hypothetical protein